MSAPMERQCADMLRELGIQFVDDRKTNLDFYLPLFDLYIEVKQFHSPRIAEQMRP